MNVRAAFATALLHAPLLLALMPLGCTTRQPPPPPPPAAVSLMTPDNKLSALETGDAACERTYVGIGIRHTWDAVFEVAPGSPAERAGVLVGDTIMNMPILGRDRYAIGTEIVLRIERGGRQFMLPMRVARICES